MEVPCWGAPLAVLGTPPDVCGDCSPVDTPLGSGKRLVQGSLEVKLPTIWRVEKAEQRSKVRR